MILGSDTRPERQLYRLGSVLLEVLLQSDSRRMGVVDLYLGARSHTPISASAFLMALDWLFLVGAVDSEEGSVIRCF